MGLPAVFEIKYNYAVVKRKWGRLNFTQLTVGTDDLNLGPPGVYRLSKLQN